MTIPDHPAPVARIAGSGHGGKVTRDDVTLEANPQDRGGKFVKIGGELWCIARAHWAGRHGLRHLLTYPDRGEIATKRTITRKGKPEEIWDSVLIHSHKTRQRNAPRGLTVATQENEIKDTVAKLVNAGDIIAPSVRSAQSRARADRHAQRQAEAQAERTAHLIAINDVMARPLTDAERAAIRWLYKEAFCGELPVAP